MTKLLGEALAKIPLHFIWILDCSSSMAIDGKIQALNQAILEAIPDMQSVADENPNAQVLVRAITFSNGAQWHIGAATPIGDFKWVDLCAKGVTDMGKALSMVAEQLKMLPMTDRALPPALVLISDGQPTDDFAAGLKNLIDQPWGKRAVRIAISIGENEDEDCLQSFMGNTELKPLKANDAESLARSVKWVSTSFLKSASSAARQALSAQQPVSDVQMPSPPRGPILPICIYTLIGHEDQVRMVDWSPNGKWLATASFDQTARVWNAGSGEEILKLRHDTFLSGVVWDLEGKRLATWSTGWSKPVWLCDAGTGKPLATLSGHSPRDVCWVAWSPEGKRLATAGSDNTSKLWDVENGKELLTLIGHTDRIRMAAWSPDGKCLATGSEDGKAKVWDTNTGREFITLCVNPLHPHVAWGRSRKRLARVIDNDARVWDLERGQETLILHGHNLPVFMVAWSPDGKRLATASFDNTARVWDGESAKELLTMHGHKGTCVWGVYWSPDGTRLATLGDDNTARVWDTETGVELLTLSGHSDDVLQVAWSPDGQRLATLIRGEVKVWDAGGHASISHLSVRDLEAASSDETSKPPKGGTIPYSMVGKNFNTPEIQGWLSKVGISAQITRYDDCYYYSFKTIGISLAFNSDDTLSAIFLYCGGANGYQQYQGALPFGLTFQLTRKKIESILGQPDQFGGGAINYWTRYLSKGIGIEYNTKQTDDLSARISVVSLQIWTSGR